MPRALAEKVPRRSSASLSPPPAARIFSPFAGVLMVGSGAPSHSMPTRLTPKSSAARTLKVSVSMSSTTFCRGRSSTESVGASSALPLIATLNGALPSRPRVSRQRTSIGREASIGVGSPVSVGPTGTRGLPSTWPEARSRLAVAAKRAVLPLTSDTLPPRTSFRRGLGRSR